jgi:hypothetical protein
MKRVWWNCCIEKRGLESVLAVSMNAFPGCVPRNPVSARIKIRQPSPASERPRAGGRMASLMSLSNAANNQHESSGPQQANTGVSLTCEVLEQFHENCSRTEADPKAFSPRASPSARKSCFAALRPCAFALKKE